VQQSITLVDVIILGAGPAGSTATIALQHSGLKVAVLEKETFPRDKICGDAVSSVTKRVLRQINPELEQKLLQLPNKASITKAKLYSPKFEPLTLQFSLVGHCIKRLEFDNWLFEEACKNHNASIHQHVKIKQLELFDEYVEVTLDDGKIFRAKVLLGCDGAHSIAAKKLANFTVDKQHYSGAVRQYYKNVKGLTGDELEVYFLKDYLPGYFWIFPHANNQANVGFGMLSKTISDKKIDLKKSLHNIIHHIPEVYERFKDAEPLEDVKGFGLPLGSKKHTISGNRFMLCGDAASLIDPFSGEGIETAMESGKFAAEQAIKCFEQNDFSATFMKAYDERVYKKMWGNFKNHYYLQRLLGDRTTLINSLISIGNIGWVNKRLHKLFY
jgi:geranylgeranyl reductase family protein